MTTPQTGTKAKARSVSARNPTGPGTRASGSGAHATNDLATPGLAAAVEAAIRSLALPWRFTMKITVQTGGARVLASAEIGGTMGRGTGRAEFEPIEKAARAAARSWAKELADAPGLAQPDMLLIFQLNWIPSVGFEEANNSHAVDVPLGLGARSAPHRLGLSWEPKARAPQANATPDPIIESAVKSIIDLEAGRIALDWRTGPQRKDPRTDLPHVPAIPLPDTGRVLALTRAWYAANRGILGGLLRMSFTWRTPRDLSGHQRAQVARGHQILDAQPDAPFD